MHFDIFMITVLDTRLVGHNLSFILTFFSPYNILLTEAQAQASLSQMLLRFGTMCY